jgi:hypothetical protein
MSGTRQSERLEWAQQVVRTQFPDLPEHEVRIVARGFLKAVERYEQPEQVERRRRAAAEERFWQERRTDYQERRSPAGPVGAGDAGLQELLHRMHGRAMALEGLARSKTLRHERAAQLAEAREIMVAIEQARALLEEGGRDSETMRAEVLACFARWIGRES